MGPQITVPAHALVEITKCYKAIRGTEVSLNVFSE